MIIDLERFLAEERGAWRRLEAMLDRLDRDPAEDWTLDEARQFHYLYERTASDLARLATFSFERETRRYLETLVGRAYARIHPPRERPGFFAPWRWFTRTFPQAFRRRIRAFQLACAITLGGALVGALAVAGDLSAKDVLMPFDHLQQRPSERVRIEENSASDRPGCGVITFSAFLMTNNIRVSILCLALGVFWGAGTGLVLFANGIMVGAVAADYALDGQAVFLLGWLLPHGTIEIPAILIAGQAGLVLGGALLGRADGRSLRARLRAAAPDLGTLIGGVAVLLVWAAIVEAFLSQHHEPVLPYAWKIAIGLAELAVLAWFLARAGTGPAAAGARRACPGLWSTGTPAERWDEPRLRPAARHPARASSFSRTGQARSA